MKKHLILLLIAFPKILFGQSEWLDSLDKFITKEIIDYKVPGLAIGIIKDNDVVFMHGYGVTSLNSNSKITPETVFPIASCTKTFTAACIGILVDEGKLQWNDKVIKYLPDFKLSDPWITKELTISDLLCHRSGLGTFDGDLLWYGTDYSRKEIIDKMQYYPIKNDFRIQFGYQNIMYLVAGMIIEKVSGESWDKFVKDKIFNSLSMQNSSSSIIKMQLNDDYARPHLGNRTVPLLNLDNIGSAGSVNSSIQDMLNWVQMWINKGEWNGKIIISQDVYQTATSPKIMISNNSEESYGFGWYIGTVEGEKVIYHGGGISGYKSSVYILPDRKIGIVILTNRITYFNQEITDLIIEKFLYPGKINWSEADKYLFTKRMSSDLDNERDNGEKTRSKIPTDFSKYEGTYKDNIYGEAIINQKNGQPFLKLLPTKELFSGYMNFLNKTQFEIVFNDRFIRPGKVVFEIDSISKQVTSFKLDIISGDLNFKDLNFKKIK